MAVLSDSDRVLVWALSMRSELGTLALTKADLRAAVNALDTFMTTNEGAVNTAIPQPARGALTTKQKAALLMLVINQRYVVAV